jgi:predicted GNAT superfamily acetyltransferase
MTSAVTNGQALTEAREAAERAGVTIAPLSEPADLDVLRDLMAEIWGPEIVPPRNLLRGLALGGNCLLLARQGERPVGFALGWLGWNEVPGEHGPHLHSHQVGVTSDQRGTGVGLALKLAQRSLALAHGITRMRWTFDPLLATNARFNLLRLGATVVDFLPHCYGDRTDAFNTGDTTDRVEVEWRLDAPLRGGSVLAGPDDELLAVPEAWTSWRLERPDEAADLRRTHGAALHAAVREGRLRGWGTDARRPDSSGWVLAASPERTST